MVCSLDQAFGGIEQIRVKKKSKKNKNKQNILYPQEITAIDRNFDEEASGIAPFDGSEFGGRQIKVNEARPRPPRDSRR